MDTFEEQEEDNRGQDQAHTLAPGVRFDLESAPRFWSFDEAHAAIQVDTSIYSVNCILRAAYKFTERSYFLVSPDDEHPGRCIVFACMKPPGRDVERTLESFVNELLDQRLREILEREFGDLRTLIVAQAFSEGNLLDPSRDEGDYRTDSGNTEELR